MHLKPIGGVKEVLGKIAEGLGCKQEFLSSLRLCFSLTVRTNPVAHVRNLLQSALLELFETQRGRAL